MRRLNRFRSPESQLNVTPMLDVVFILLIFFIVTASFIKEATIDLGRTGGGAKTATISGNIHVSLGPDDRIWVNHRPVNPTAIVTNIKQLHAENPQAKVVVTAHPESSAGLLVKVIDSSRLAGVNEVSLAQAR